MTIQIIIFLTKNNLFAAEINNNGQADAISINGNPEIKCEGKESIDELIECLFDAFSIDDFGDEHFDIVIVDCGGDKNVIVYASEKCMGADKFSIIGVEKLLPLIVWNKTQLQAGEEVVAAFDEACYKVACDDNNIVKYIGKARKGKENITLEMGDFGCLYNFKAEKVQGSAVDTGALQEKDAIIQKLEEEKENLAETLNEKESSLTILQKEMQEVQDNLNALIEEKSQWEKDHQKPSSLVEQMVKIVEECKKNAKALSGDLYIRGSIPKKKLESAINLLSENIGESINKNDVIAIYFPGSDDEDDVNIMLICNNYFCIDKGYNYEEDEELESKDKKICWGNLVKAYQDSYTLKLKLNSGKVIDVGLGSSIDTKFNIVKFFVPLFNKLKDLDELQ